MHGEAYVHPKRQGALNQVCILRELVQLPHLTPRVNMAEKASGFELWKAARKNDIATVERLLTPGADPNVTHWDTNFALLLKVC